MGNKLAVWDPTSQTISLALVDTGSFLQQLALQTRSPNTQLFLAHLHVLEQQLPDVSTWIVPRLVWIMIGVALVMLASIVFQRFRNVLG